MTTEDIVEEKPPESHGTQDEGNESVSTCVICMEDLTIGSEHRVCCLKCGHLFGRSCIERWIRERGTNAKCPTCSKPARKIDLRDLWCKSIKATDDTEINRLQTLLEEEKKTRRSDAATIFQQNLRIEQLHEDINKLKRDVRERDAKIIKLQVVLDRYNQLRAQKLASVNEILDSDTKDLEDPVIEIDVDVQPQQLRGKFYFSEKVDSISIGGCKSFALCPTSSIILVAQPSPANSRNVFAGFGLRKYSMVDTNVREFIPLHTKIITSIQLKPIGDLILTSGQDRQVRITSTSNNICIQTYHSQFEPTCVAWSAHRDQQFYVGSGNCYVSLYDMRNTSEYIYQTSQRVANTRLLSIASTTGPLDLNGLLVNDARGCQFLEVSQGSCYDQDTIDASIDHFTKHQLPFEGLMGSVDFNKRLGMALITTRRTPMSPNCAHNLVKLNKVQDDNGGMGRVECSRVRTFTGGRSGELLSQSRILPHPTLEGFALVGACDEGARGIKLWDSSDNTEYQTIRADSFIRDMIMYTPENSNLHTLYTLCEKGLSIYRWECA